MGKQSAEDALTEDKLIKLAVAQERKGRKKKLKHITSDELCDAVPVRINRRSTLKGYKGTNIYVPSTQAGIHHSNLVMAEMFKQTIMAYMENIIGYGAARMKPSDFECLARATKMACELAANSMGTDAADIPTMNEKQKNIFGKYFKTMGNISKAAEKEFNEEEFDKQLEKVEEVIDDMDKANDEFVESEQKWRSKAVKDHADVYYEDVGKEGVDRIIKEHEEYEEPKTDKRTLNAQIKKEVHRVVHKPMLDEATEVMTPKGYPDKDEDDQSGRTERD